METLVIASLINFVVMVSIIAYFAKKPVEQFLAKRSETIANDIKDAERLAAEAQKALAQWESKWDSSQALSKKNFSEAEASLALVKKNTLEAAAMQASRIQADSKRVAQGEVARAKNNLKKEFVLKSVEVAGRYLGRNIREEDRHKLVSEYLEKVVNGKE
jgi:F-type H+-transporting ATPase subunit b